MTTPVEATQRTPLTVLQGGTAAGAMDLTAALLVSALYGVGPVRVLQSIASGVLGEAANGSAAAAVLGVVLHFAIMLVICWVFLTAARRFAFLTRRVVLSGALYGVAVYLFMQYVVLPLSAYPYGVASSLAPIVRGTIIHIVCVGLPIALIVRRNLR